jgi:hypothetical protein
VKAEAASGRRAGDLDDDFCSESGAATASSVGATRRLLGIRHVPASTSEHTITTLALETEEQRGTGVLHCVNLVPFQFFYSPFYYAERSKHA